MALPIKRNYFSSIQKAIELFGGFQKTGVCILMFHQVNDDTSKWVNKNVAISFKSFKTLILSYLSQGFSFVPIGEIEANVDCDKAISITFDDIFYDTAEEAIPFLTELGIPFCVFISDCFINKENYLTSDQLHSLLNNRLCTIGYHSKSHIMMRNLTTEEILEEIDCSAFERAIKKKIDYLAFPYGSVFACGLKKASISKSMYKYSFSTISVKCSKKWLICYPYYLPRINVNEGNYHTLLDLK